MAKDFEEEEQTIAENPLTPERAAAALKFLEKCQYITTCVLALAEVCDEFEDADGARMLRKFADDFREYEATTL
jgi:hypothetical protein